MIFYFSVNTIILISATPIHQIDLPSLTHSYRWIHYRDCEEGISSIALFSKQIHAVFVCDGMSFLSGIQIRTLLHKQYPSLPVIILYTSRGIIDFFEQADTGSYLGSSIDFISLKRQSFQL